MAPLPHRHQEGMGTYLSNLYLHQDVTDLQDFANILSRTQVTTQDVTRLCNEIRNIKKGAQQNPDVLNKDTVLNTVSSNTPAPARDTRGRDDHDDVENEDNKLHLDPPIDNWGNQIRCAPLPLPDQTEYGRMPPGPLSSHTPLVSAAKTSSPASSNAAEDPEVSPSDEHRVSCSPDSPNETKASSRQ